MLVFYIVCGDITAFSSRTKIIIWEENQMNTIKNSVGFLFTNLEQFKEGMKIKLN
jgi:hypothetical protein